MQHIDMKLDFHTLDVFTTRKFAGNPLAVVLGADDLTTEQMQTITKEFNLSETTFVMKPDDPANTAKMRIFFPGGEMPFAGHPTLGTALLLAEMRNLSEVRFELKAGLTPVKISGQYGVFTAPVVPFHVPKQLPSISETARALNLSTDDIGFENHEIALLEGGPRFFYVPVKTRAALEKSQVRQPYWEELLAPLGGSADAAYIYTRGGEGANTHFRARMYAPSGGIPEDPATGSATALLAAQLLSAEKLSNGTHTWNLEQGYEMGRPSDLRLEADVNQSKLVAVRVGGSAVRMMSGQIEI
jgi:trans-2,3-dihydro-3-hydroxyanthranilate isomerase